MEVINGWEIQRDAGGFWAVSTSVRQGPYGRKSQAQDFARLTPIAPEPTKSQTKRLDAQRT